MLLKILLIIAAAIVVAVIYIKIRRYRSNIDNMYRAAGNIIRNEMLDNSLHNPMLGGYKNPLPQGKRLMIYFKLLDSKPVREYVFDPFKCIKIGRDKDINSIVLNEAIVSLEHCYINVIKDKICLSDCGSSNGTQIKRGFRTYGVSGAQQVALESGDVLVVGSSRMKIRVFVYDTVWM